MAPLAEVANKEKQLPRAFISADGFHITPACRTYLAPLIQGEAYPPFKHGLPEYVTLTQPCRAQKAPYRLHAVNGAPYSEYAYTYCMSRRNFRGGIHLRVR